MLLVEELAEGCERFTLRFKKDDLDGGLKTPTSRTLYVTEKQNDHGEIPIGVCVWRTLETERPQSEANLENSEGQSDGPPHGDKKGWRRNSGRRAGQTDWLQGAAQGSHSDSVRVGMLDTQGQTIHTVNYSPRFVYSQMDAYARMLCTLLTHFPSLQVELERRQITKQMEW